MNMNEERALKTAEYLLQIKAIKLSPANPYTWASGWKSPIYCDNRKTLSYPQIRTFLRQEMVKLVEEEFGSVDLIAGVATGGIALGVLVAQDLGLPFAYVRAAEKKHGLGNQIEGVVESGQSVVVIEDLISTGKSSLAAVDALREAGCQVKGMIAIFTYAFPHAEASFKKANCILHTLSSYPALIEQAFNAEFITSAQVELLEQWRENPDTWGQNP
ncbi:MAG: orotate phosphoribosyltransferase [Chroococcales cyanobacterium metabat2.561]|nr:MAG: orotate phosphoribosyltransferase [Chroococcales cyanobacterium metabat2.561]